MRIAQVRWITSHTFKQLIRAPINRWLIGALMSLLMIAIGSSYLRQANHQHNVDHYSQDIREKWENNPDKHPHRMAHYGYVAFRSKYPLSFFDSGIDSYLGNMVFLEAHRQNSVNFSQVSLSNGISRFGELSAGLVFQLLLPLLIFFWGYSSISEERQKGVLKLFLAQGARWEEIILAKSLGIYSISLLIFIPALLISLVLLICSPHILSIIDSVMPLILLGFCYLIYLYLMSFLAVWVSATSSSSKISLMKLIGFWIFFTLIIPKLSLVVGQLTYPTPSKIEFDTMVEHELIEQGDSHNPDDPHFNALRDSLLASHNVTSPQELPFNYSGYIMKEGEKLSTETFRKHQAMLFSLYEKQSQVVNFTAVLNPYIAIKHISMVLSGTDFGSYLNFKRAAEDYRYNLAQTMNDLQIKHIGNKVASSADKNAVISQRYWAEIPRFQHGFPSFIEMIKTIKWSVSALSLWLIGSVFLVVYHSKHLKAI